MTFGDGFLLLCEIKAQEGMNTMRDHQADTMSFVINSLTSDKNLSVCEIQAFCSAINSMDNVICTLLYRFKV